MKGNFAWLGRVALTAIALVAALAVGRALWVYYMELPWTRDGRVRADVVQVAPDVSGFVTDVLVKDNQQVHRGDILFRIDRARFALALQQAGYRTLGGTWIADINAPSLRQIEKAGARPLHRLHLLPRPR